MSDQGGESLGTVTLAGAMNLAIALAKGIAGFLSGSAAMLSEAAHSVADTTTEALLFVALRRGARPADGRHPFGYGREAYFWAFMAAAFTFVVGGGFSIVHGISEILADREPGDYLVSYVVLVIAFVLEGVSLRRGLRQTSRQATSWQVSIGRYLNLTPDTTVKAVVMEDVAALIGLLLASGGLVLSEVTHDPRYDGAASVLIGFLLIAVAVTLALSNKSLLIGQSVPQRLQEAIAEELRQIPTVQRVRKLYTLHLGPDQILVAAKVDFADAATGQAIEAAADAAERRLRERFPAIRYVFLDPTPEP